MVYVYGDGNKKMIGSKYLPIWYTLVSLMVGTTNFHPTSRHFHSFYIYYYYFVYLKFILGHPPFFLHLVILFCLFKVHFKSSNIYH